jgi:glyoxylase-like metal-dependent hydrolase (beta-lactamase superfamily II)
MSVNAPGLKSWAIGDFRVTVIMELDTMVIPPAIMLRTDAEEIKKHAWLVPDFADEEGRLKVHIQAFVIEAHGHRILVDPCIGNDKPRRTGAIFNMLKTPFLDHMVAAGFAPETIDLVLCTHLHLDHVGWNTRLVDGKWVPTFPKARYLMGHEEFEFTQILQEEEGAVLTDSILPIVEAGLVDFVETDHEILPGITLEPSPGHTPGHCCIRLHSHGQEAIILGDALHHPIQAALPNLASNFCHDPVVAGATRTRLLSRCCNADTILFGNHFAGPIAVVARPHESNWILEPKGGNHGDPD